MKINELLGEFEIFTTNEEEKLLGSLDNSKKMLNSFSEREQVILQNLINKSLVSKVRENNSIMVVKNAKDVFDQRTRKSS